MMIFLKGFLKEEKMIELNKIFYMDCLEGMKQLEDNSIDLVLIDTPYNLNKFSFSNI